MTFAPARRALEVPGHARAVAPSLLTRRLVVDHGRLHASMCRRGASLPSAA